MTQPRKVYLDTEFLTSDPTTSGLVSIGLTDDSGRDYYAVNAQMDAVSVHNHPWMRANVWPYLPNGAPDGLPHLLNYAHPDVKDDDQIREEIADYFALDGEDQETHLYAYYGGQDIFRLHSLWGHDWANMPDQIPTWFFDLKALRVQAGNPEMPPQDDNEHHALADARYNRRMHEHLLSLAGQLANGPVPATGQPCPDHTPKVAR